MKLADALLDVCRYLQEQGERTNPGFDAALVVDLLTMIEGRGYSRGQQLIEKWKNLRRSLSL